MSALTQITPQPGAIRALRKARGISQQQLSAMAGCSLSMIRMLDGGYAPARSEVLERVIAILNDDDPSGKGVGANDSAGQDRREAG